MPFCTNCGAELHNAKFCPECGTPTGGCDTGPDLSALCDKHRTPIDLSLVLGVYRNRLSVIGYFKRFTNYSNEEIIAIVDKAIATIEPQKMNLLQAAAAQVKLESAPKAEDAQNPLSKRETIAQRKVEDVQKPLSKREAIAQRKAENKANGVACCPKCGSTSLSANKKGFGIGKAVVGALVTGPIGLVAGNAGAKKVWVTCLNCGHRWKI